MARGRRIRTAGWNALRATLLDMGPLCTWSGKVKIRESDVPELNKHILNIIMIMVKNFIIKIITSLVKVQMLQQGVNTPLEEEAMLLPFQESPLPPPPQRSGLDSTLPTQSGWGLCTCQAGWGPPARWPLPLAKSQGENANPSPNGETFTYVLYNIQRNRHPRQHDFHSQCSPRLMGLWGKTKQKKKGKKKKKKYYADGSALKTKN